jgi:deoxyhypusine synthase
MLYQDMEMHDVPFGVISVKFQIQQLVTVPILEQYQMKNYLGKLDIKTPKFIIESDATIVAPLIFAYLLDL